MKKIFSAISIAAFLAACNPTPQTTAPSTPTTVATPSDTTGLAQYQLWKSQHELVPNNSPNGVMGAATVANPPVTRSTTTTHHSTTTHNSSGNMSSSSNNTAMAPAPQKKGWSKAAKGAVIGGVGGAVIGGVLDKKNHAAGAVIGGVLGAGAGYGIGRGQDKKSGRY